MASILLKSRANLPMFHLKTQWFCYARGTGKTVVARMVGQLLVEMGVIKKAFQTDVALDFGLFHMGLSENVGLIFPIK